VNAKRVYRLYREKELQVRTAKRTKEHDKLECHCRSSNRTYKPELSTWLGIGTFYLAPTGSHTCGFRDLEMKFTLIGTSGRIAFLKPVRSALTEYVPRGSACTTYSPDH